MRIHRVSADRPYVAVFKCTGAAVYVIAIFKVNICTGAANGIKLAYLRRNTNRMRELCMSDRSYSIYNMWLHTSCVEITHLCVRECVCSCTSVMVC